MGFTFVLLLIVIILYCIFVIISLEYKKQKSKARMLLHLRRSLTALKFSFALKEAVKRLDKCDINEKEFEILRSANSSYEKYAVLIHLLQTSGKNGTTTVIQNITGPSNNGNVNLKLQANLLPIFPLLR